MGIIEIPPNLTGKEKASAVRELQRNLTGFDLANVLDILAEHASAIKDIKSTLQIWANIMLKKELVTQDELKQMGFSVCWLNGKCVNVQLQRLPCKHQVNHSCPKDCTNIVIAKEEEKNGTDKKDTDTGIQADPH